MYRFCVCILIALFSPFVSTRAVPRAYPGLNTTLLRLVHDNAVNSSTQRYVGTSQRISHWCSSNRTAKLGDWHTRRGADGSQMATAFCVPIRLTSPSCDPSLVGERKRCFGHRRDVSICHLISCPTIGRTLVDHTQRHQPKGQRIASSRRWRWGRRRSRK